MKLQPKHRNRFALLCKLIKRNEECHIKYMGSKSRIAKDIVPIIQKCIDDNKIDTYIENFVGGSNMIEHIKCATKNGYDSNKYFN